MDVQRLRQKVADSALTCEEIAAAIGVDPSTYYRKINAAGENFTVAQAKKLATVLRLTHAEASEIFLG